MPQVMTEEEATGKTCPFISDSNKRLYCAGSMCACWGWVDDEHGQTAYVKSVTIARDATPDHEEGIVWQKTGNSGLRNASWSGYAVTGLRRGRCEAMSPIIEVET